MVAEELQRKVLKRLLCLVAVCTLLLPAAPALSQQTQPSAPDQAAISKDANSPNQGTAQGSAQRQAPAAGSDPSQSQLRGLAAFGSVVATVTKTQPYLLPVCRARDFQCVQVHIKNESDQPVTIDGDQAKAVIAGNLVDPRNTAQITNNSCCRMSVGSEILLTVVSLSLVGLPIPIMYEKLTNKREGYFYNHGYGWMDDGIRHEIEGARFGKRVMLQGDETDGWFCFKAAELTGTATLRIPVSSGNKSGLIEVPVQIPATKAASPTGDRKQ